jgi:hypothetical protein
MTATAFKILLFMKRRPGLTMAEFVDYYENHHVPLALKYGSSMTGYTRRYLTPQPNAATGQNEELPYDVITELSYDDETTFQRTLAYLSRSAMPDEIVEDEKRLFDRAKQRMATVIEHSTQAKPKT